jgi:hypothetical protein
VKELLTVQSRCGLLCDGCSAKLRGKCPGCIALNGKASWKDAPCTESQCCIDKGFVHCGECPDFPCKGVKGMSCDDGDECDNPKGARLDICRMWNEHKCTV